MSAVFHGPTGPTGVPSGLGYTYGNGYTGASGAGLPNNAHPFVGPFGGPTGASGAGGASGCFNPPTGGVNVSPGAAGPLPLNFASGNLSPAAYFGVTGSWVEGATGSPILQVNAGYGQLGLPTQL